MSFQLKSTSPKRTLDKAMSMMDHYKTHRPLIVKPDGGEITEFIMKEIMVTCSRIEKVFEEVNGNVSDLGHGFLRVLRKNYIQKVYKHIKRNGVFTE